MLVVKFAHVGDANTVFVINYNHDNLKFKKMMFMFQSKHSISPSYGSLL